MARITFNVNGETRCIRVEHYRSLLWVLRETLGLTGTKEGCGEGECGACSVILDGKLVNACLVLAGELDGRTVVTIEGLTRDSEPTSIQKAFVEKGAIQCGFCSPGMIVAARALLDRNLYPTESEIKKAIEGNLCRCTGYTKIVQAIQSVADGEIQGEPHVG